MLRRRRIVMVLIIAAALFVERGGGVNLIQWLPSPTGAAVSKASS